VPWHPSLFPPLPAGEAHVWWTYIDREPADLELLQAALPPDERERASRFRLARDRRRFLVARSLLRLLLGRYAGRLPAELRFRYGPAGKPALAAEDLGWLRFNLSHSAELLVVAVAAEREVGVDVERVDEELDWSALCRFLPEAEQAGLAALETQPPSIRRRAFFQAWTGQEAWLKALGQGLGQTDESGGQPMWPKPGWSQQALELGPAFAGSLVVEGEAPSVRLLGAVPVEVLRQVPDSPAPAP
jgi:4'-phosphopantetheinyl transferase